MKRLAMFSFLIVITISLFPIKNTLAQNPIFDVIHEWTEKHTLKRIMGPITAQYYEKETNTLVFHGMKLTTTEGSEVIGKSVIRYERGQNPTSQAFLKAEDGTWNKAKKLLVLAENGMVVIQLKNPDTKELLVERAFIIRQ